MVGREGVEGRALIVAWVALTLPAVVACTAAVESATPAPTEHLAVASQSSVPRELLRYYAHDGAECLANARCPFQGASVPACGRLDAEPPTLDKVGKQIRVRGAAQAMPSRNTQQNCTSDKPCCQTVWGNLGVETKAGRVTLSATEGLPQLDDAYGCVGDRSALCCGFAAMGREVIASGTLQTFSYKNAANELQQGFVLMVGGFCQIGETNNDATNLSKINVASSFFGP